MKATRALLGLLRGFSAWRASPSGERRLFAEAWCALLYHDALFRRHKTGARVPRSPAPPRLNRRDSPGTDHLVAVFDRAAHNHLGRVACLPRSLALLGFLSRHGVDATLRLGVRRCDAGVEGHAWIERGGEPVRDRRESVAAFVRTRIGSEDGTQ